MKMAASVLVYGSLAFFMGLGAFGLFFDDMIVWAALSFCFVSFLIGGLLFLGYTAFRPSLAKVNDIILAGSVAALCVKAEAPLRRWGVDVFWNVREVPATAFVAELLSYGRISSMDDGTRYYKELNHELINRPSRLSDLAPTDPAAPNVFRRDGIDTRVLAEFRRRLSALGLFSVSVTDDYVAFVDDGFLDNLRGFVWVRPGHAPPPIRGEFVEATQLIQLRPLSNGWYYFETT
jgi:hypothetical protein